MSLMHLDLIVIGLKGLTIKIFETKVLVAIFDDRWSHLKKSIIG